MEFARDAERFPVQPDQVLGAQRQRGLSQFLNASLLQQQVRLPANSLDNMGSAADIAEIRAQAKESFPWRSQVVG